MSGLVEHVTRWENAQLEAIFNEEPKCESPGHWRTPEDHGGPAATRLLCPCGYNGVICGTFRDILVASASGFRCAYGVHHENAHLHFLDL